MGLKTKQNGAEHQMPHRLTQVGRSKTSSDLCRNDDYVSGKNGNYMRTFRVRSGICRCGEGCPRRNREDTRSCDRYAAFGVQQIWTKRQFKPSNCLQSNSR